MGFCSKSQHRKVKPANQTHQFLPPHTPATSQGTLMPGIPTLARCCRTVLHSSSPSSHACCSGAGNPYMGPRQLCPCQHPPNHAQPALQAAQWEGARSNSIAMQTSRPMKFGPNGLTFPSPSRMQTLLFLSMCSKSERLGV